MNDYSQYILMAYGSALLMVLVLGGMMYGKYRRLKRELGMKE